ncbi:MAG: LamG domain-containing protein [Saprospiraceae bacterium]
MKHLIALALVVLFPLAFDFPSENFDLEEGLVAYYSFNACDARDDSGNGSDGVLYGQPGCHCGVDDDALLLDGEDDYIEFEGYVNRFFNTSDFTISFYIKPTRQSAFPLSLFSKREQCDSNHLLDIRLNQALQEVQTDFRASEFNYYRNLEAQTDGPGWFQFTLVREGQKAYTYINGNLRGQARRCSAVDISNEALLSFANSPCLHEGRMLRFKGALDELRIYDRALTPAEVAGLYQRFPVELAEIDCVSMLPENLTPPGSRPAESRYLCAAK